MKNKQNTNTHQQDIVDLIKQELRKFRLKLKNTLDFNEAAEYLNLSPSFLYKLTSQNLISYYKPNGKKIYFQRVELDAWASQNKVATAAEIEQQAQNFLVGGA